MISKLITRLSITLLFLCCFTQLFAAQPISFSGGYTRAVMREGQETILLSQGAVVEAGSIQFEAQSIELIGPEARYITAQGNVQIIDKEQQIMINSTSLSYDREMEQLLVDGWVEVQDLKHEILASGAYLSYSRNLGLMKLQISAKLLRHTESGPMVCRADSIEYDRNNQQLLLIGNSEIQWKSDVYRSAITTVNLQTDEIIMEGAIEGTFHE